MSTPTQIPDVVLSWLHNTLTTNYNDVNRTYSDVARALAFQPTLQPRTDSYTYENGTSRLLLRLHGTLPVAFRGSTYRFPLSVWVPHVYPRQPPMIFIDADNSLVVRPGQHVSVEGRVYHPYLAHWQGHWDRSNILDILTILQDIFAKEPPVSARPDVGPARHARLDSQTPRPTSASAMPSQPPALPPKTLNTAQVAAQSDAGSRSAGPPRPPKPGQMGPAEPSARLSDTHGHQQQHAGRIQRPGDIMVRNDQTREPDRDRYGQPAPLPQSNTLQGQPPIAWNQHNVFQPTPGLQHLAGTQFPSRPTSLTGASLPSRPASHAGVAPTATIKLPAPIQDLMSTPLDLPLRTQEPNLSLLTAPPIPRNPEKDALLDATSTILRAQLKEALTQNDSALPALEAQQVALHAAMRNMQSEKYHLDELNEYLSRNEQILRDSMLEAEGAVDNAKQRDAPNVDDVLVAPTVVGEQLYKLVADERSIDDAMFALTKALDRGRISSDVFLKQTRSLAREQFLHKALTKKIARGMGLAETATL